MLLKTGDLFKSNDDFILVTANAYINKNKALVMGRGAARQLKDMQPKFPYLAADAIKWGQYPLDFQTQRPVYGVILISRYGIFQVKYNWWEDASLDLIKFSTDELLSLAVSGFLGDRTVSMNYPGIGNGRLKEQDVYPIISKLPDCISVYKFA